MLNHHDNRRSLNIRSLADDITRNPKLAAAVFDEFVNQMEVSPVQMHNFASSTAALVDPKTLDLFVHLGMAALKIRKKG